ncbi:hypothetical protein TNCV_1814031 [Trichonephila clavipes]|nr:hypothetical protein TNCV_1814031 [Trichonephila clavipes]
MLVLVHIDVIPALTNGVEDSVRGNRSKHPDTMTHKKGLSIDEIANSLRDLSENESDSGELSCSNLNSDEDIRSNESD